MRRAISEAEAATAREPSTSGSRLITQRATRSLRAAARLGGAACTREEFSALLEEVDHERGCAPDVDLLIRTGGEQRLSDFLLWECAYAELIFTPRMWPDFGRADLEAAIAEFHARERRSGASRRRSRHDRQAEGPR